MNIGLFFGSFNPFHIGHKAIASYIAEYTSLEQVWFVVSPQNPLKSKSSLLDQYHRLQIIRAEIDDVDNLIASDIEFSLPQPSYTIDTLAYLKENFFENQFSLIMGADNLQSFHKWKNFQQILKDYSIYVYPRHGYEVEGSHNNIHLIQDVPQMEISASFIRNSIKKGRMFLT
jgi:nicotinate-nucleotide adenylyltransferase